MSLHVDFPFHFGAAGKTASTTNCDWARDLIFQYLLTFQGERVNRPEFGTPLSRICFEGNSYALADVVQFLARAGLQRWLNDEVEVVDLTAEADEAVLTVDLKYRVRGEDCVRQATRRIPALR